MNHPRIINSSPLALIQWSPYVEMCVLTGRPAILGAVWGAPVSVFLPKVVPDGSTIEL
jgi:hypothetical protein